MKTGGGSWGSGPPGGTGLSPAAWTTHTSPRGTDKWSTPAVPPCGRRAAAADRVSRARAVGAAGDGVAGDSADTPGWSAARLPEPPAGPEGEGPGQRGHQHAGEALLCPGHHPLREAHHGLLPKD